MDQTDSRKVADDVMVRGATVTRRLTNIKHTTTHRRAQLNMETSVITLALMDGGVQGLFAANRVRNDRKHTNCVDNEQPCTYESLPMVGKI